SMILFSKFKGLKFRPLYIAGFFVGLFVMFLSGSRSPFLALIITILIFQIFNQGVFKGISYLLILLIPFFMFYDQLIGYLDQYGSNFLVRLTSALEGDKSGRDNLFTVGFEDFLNYPIFGNSFLISKG